MQKLCLPLVTRDSMDCYYRCLTILSMFPITFINLKTPRLCLWRRRSWGCGCSVNRACKYLTKNLCLQPLITGSVNIRDPNRQKNLKSTICNWSDHAILEKKFTIWKPLRRKNAASDTSKRELSEWTLIGQELIHLLSDWSGFVLVYTIQTAVSAQEEAQLSLTQHTTQ